MIMTDLSDQLFSGKLRTAVTVGKFDGLHRGHRELIRYTAEKKNEGLVPLILMIDMNIGPGKKSILDREEERETLESLGAEIVVRVPFTDEFRKLSAERFSEEILAERLGARSVVSGEDFCFGKGRQGNPGFLQSVSKRLGFEYECLPRVFYENSPVSSSRIRECLASGRVEEAKACLGEPYRIRGTVAHGMHLASGLGFPTANILPPEEKFLPRYGVYRVFSEIDGTLHKGLANLGVKPTVPGERKAVLEVYFPGYSGDLYGKTLSVLFDAFLRPEQKFPDLSHLKVQIQEDLLRL